MTTTRENLLKHRGIRGAARRVVMALVLLTGLALLGQTACAQDGTWTVGPLEVPPPAGASQTLRDDIAATPQPDVAESQALVFKTPEDWKNFAAPKDAAKAEEYTALAESLSVKISEGEMGGVPVYTLTPPKPDPAFAGKLFVYTHGGAYVINSGRAGLREAILIAHRLGMAVVSIDYRMPPDHPYPAAIDDVVAVWRQLLKERPASAMAIGGSSAGGGLSLAAVLRFKELGLDLPAAVYAGTPWADLSKTGDSEFTNTGIDRVLVTYEGMLECAALVYADGRDLKTPLISPVYGDFAGYAPTILVSGTRDLFLSDTARTHRAIRAAGVPSELHVYEGVSHGGFIALLDAPETGDFFRELGDFLRRHLKAFPPTAR